MLAKSLLTPVFRTLGMILMAAAVSLGQSTSGSVNGTVKDSGGAVVPGATVTVTNPATSVTQTAVTADDGGFSVPQLPPGNYTITIEKAGFKKLEKTDVILSAADRLNAGEFVLEVGAIGETVIVQADAGQLQIKSESGERSDLITNTQIKDLALNGRNILDLVKVVPGVISTANNQVSQTTGLSSIFINGGRGNQHQVTLDGGSNVDNGDNGGLQVTVNPDAIQEVKILTSNFQAEYGKAGGGSFAFVTKSGTNEFHGTARYFRRHDSLNANSFFNNARGTAPGGGLLSPRPLYRYNYYGYDIGGPVILPRFGEGGPKFFSGKNRLFFFFSQEFYRQLVPNGVRNIRVPTAAERNGDFSNTFDGLGTRIYVRDPVRSGNCNATTQAACFPNNIIPRERFYSNGQAILNLYPLPNVTGGNQFNYTSQISGQFPRREDIIRVDAQITDQTRLTGRYVNNADRQELPYGNFAAVRNFPFGVAAFTRPSRNGVLTLTNTLSSTLVNEFIFGAGHNRVLVGVEDEFATRARGQITTPLLFANANPLDYLPNFQYGGVPGQTLPDLQYNGLPFLAVGNIFDFTDNLTKVAGRHTIKTGVFIQRARKDQGPGSNFNSNLNFAIDATNPLNSQYPFANALLGIYNTYTQSDGYPTGYLRYTNVEGYVQDTWRVRTRLTLDYGLRLTYYQPTFDDRLRLSVFNPELYDRARAPRIYNPVLVGTARRAIDPAITAAPTTANTLPGNFIGLVVPGSGSLTNGIAREGDNYPKGGMDSRGLLFEPRFGFAYSVTGDGKTVLRGGAGVSHDRLQVNPIRDLMGNPPNIFTASLFQGQLQAVGSGSTGTLAQPNVTGFAKDGNVPTIYSFSLGVQRDVGFGTVVDIAYVGTQSRHLLQQRNINATPYGTTFTRAAQDPTRYAGGVVPAVQAGLPAAYAQAGLSFTGANALPVELLRPFPGFGTINFREFVGTSNYNALQVAVNRRFSRGLTFGVAYTFSKAFDTADTDTAGVNPFNTRLYDYRLAGFDRTHNLVLNYVYDLPKLSRFLGDNPVARLLLDNYQLSGITQFTSGSPFELGVGITGVAAGQRISGSYTEGPRYTLRSDPRADGANGLLIDPAAIAAPALGSNGLGNRNYLRGPGINNHDISLFKNFPIDRDGARYLQLRIEAFNAFNHTQFSSINGTATLAVANPNGTFNLNADAVFNNYGQAVIATRPSNSPVSPTSPLGSFFGEYNGARDPRIIQLGVKFYF